MSVILMKDLTAIWISRLKKMLLLCASQLKIVKVTLVKFGRIIYPQVGVKVAVIIIDQDHFLNH